MRKKERSKEEQKKHHHHLMINRKIRGLATRIKNRCSDVGLQTMKHQFEFLKDNPTTKLLVPVLDHEQHVHGWELGIGKYEEALGEPETFN